MNTSLATCTPDALPAPRWSPLAPVARLMAASAAAIGALGLAALWALAGPPGWADAAACALPCAAVVGLAATSRTDRRQYLLRMLAAVLMLPPVVLMFVFSGAAPERGHAADLVMVALLLLHLAGFAALVWKLASMTTRIEPAQAQRPVSAPWLVERLRALHAAGLPWALRRDRASGCWLLTRDTPDDAGGLGKRGWELRLFIDEARGEVRVRERVGAAGARPLNADDASLRTLGDAAFDPGRPQAQRSWSVSLQASLIEPETLAAVRLHLHGPVAEAVPGAGQTLDELVHLLAALVTRSGWAWQPTLGDPAR